jgi:hypothetical protein
MQIGAEKPTANQDEDDEWLRQFTRPEEYIIQHHPSLRGGFYRWFESENVVDLVRERRRRAKNTSEPRGRVQTTFNF